MFAKDGVEVVVLLVRRLLRFVDEGWPSKEELEAVF